MGDSFRGRTGPFAGLLQHKQNLSIAVVCVLITCPPAGGAVCVSCSVMSRCHVPAARTPTVLRVVGPGAVWPFDALVLRDGAIRGRWRWIDGAVPGMLCVVALLRYTMDM